MLNLGQMRLKFNPMLKPALFTLALMIPQLAGAQMLSGPLHVVDAESVAINGQALRLFGLDAPAQDQRCTPGWRCGAWVSAEAKARYQGRQAQCHILAHDHAGRAVARCFTAGQDLARALVRGGLAFAHRGYSTAYLPDEQAARARGAGLHAVGVQSPAGFQRKTRCQPALKAGYVPQNLSED